MILAVAALENVSDDRLPPAVSGVQASIDAAVLPGSFIYLF